MSFSVATISPGQSSSKYFRLVKGFGFGRLMNCAVLSNVGSSDESRLLSDVQLSDLISGLEHSARPINPKDPSDECSDVSRSNGDIIQIYAR